MQRKVRFLFLQKEKKNCKNSNDEKFLSQPDWCFRFLSPILLFHRTNFYNSLALFLRFVQFARMTEQFPVTNDLRIFFLHRSVFFDFKIRNNAQSKNSPRSNKQDNKISNRIVTDSLRFVQPRYESQLLVTRRRKKKKTKNHEKEE